MGTLIHRARAVCSTTQQPKEEQDHLHKVLATCKYPIWAWNRMKIKTKYPTHQEDQNKGTKQPTINSSNLNNQRGYIVVPYTKGLSESIKTVCRKHWIQVYFKGGKTIKNFPVAPKDKDHITKTNGVIYRYKCDRVECDKEYIEESGTFWERFKEHLKPPSPIYDHCNITGYSISLENLSIVGR